MLSFYNKIEINSISIHPAVYHLENWVGLGVGSRIFKKKKLVFLLTTLSFEENYNCIWLPTAWTGNSIYTNNQCHMFLSVRAAAEVRISNFDPKRLDLVECNLQLGQRNSNAVSASSRVFWVAIQANGGSTFTCPDLFSLSRIIFSKNIFTQFYMPLNLPYTRGVNLGQLLSVRSWQKIHTICKQILTNCQHHCKTQFWYRIPL